VKIRLSWCCWRIPTVRSHYQGTTVEDTADWKDLACAVMICKVWKLWQYYTNPTGFGPKNDCLRFETSLFVTSYDAQGYGGGIRPHHYTGIWRTSKYILVRTSWHRPDRKHHSLQLFPWKHVCLWRGYLVMAAYICLLRICLLAANVISLLCLHATIRVYMYFTLCNPY
jgi:hypothetical protein